MDFPYSDFAVNFLEGLFAFFRAIPYGYIWSIFHDIMLVIDFGLIAILVYLFVELEPYRPKFYKNPREALKGTRKLPTLGDAGIAQNWKSILAKAESAPPQSLTLAIIEADSFVDDILKRMGIAGEHMADRLERIDTGDLQTLDRLWTAHRARNNLVHTPGFLLTDFDARRFLKDYENFLKELGVLE